MGIKKDLLLLSFFYPVYFCFTPANYRSTMSPWHLYIQSLQLLQFCHTQIWIWWKHLHSYPNWFSSLQCQVQQNSSYRTYTSTTQANTNWSNSDARGKLYDPTRLWSWSLIKHSHLLGWRRRWWWRRIMPAGCNANGDACRARSYQPVGGSCPFQWTGEACNDVPCAYPEQMWLWNMSCWMLRVLSNWGCYGGGGGASTYSCSFL